MKTKATHNLLNIPIIYSVSIVTTLLSGILLSSSIVSADVVDKVSITVPMSCTIEGTGMNTHNAEINNGQYNSAIGETTLKAFCNDTDGFAIYAIGYTDNLNGKNVLTNSELGSTHDIVTGTAISGANSNWAMKLSTVSSPTPTYPITIENSFDAFHNVPNTHTLVAKRISGTDIGQVAEGSTLKTTYQAYISSTQSAGTYTGQVKYTLVHPNDIPTPPDSMLDIGVTVNAKMKNLANELDNATSETHDYAVKAIHMANSLPANFEPSEANTVSTPDSKYPIYIFFDNTNDAGIMNFYTENNTVVMNPDSARLFKRYRNLVDISGLVDWDASQVVNMHTMFSQATSLTSLHNLSSWDTSRVTNLEMTFIADAELTTLDGLEGWDVSNVTSMLGLFYIDSGITDISALADWDVSNVSNMTQTFEGLSSLTSLHGLENWDTSSLETLTRTFYGNESITNISALANWDTSNVTDMRSLLSYNVLLTSLSPLSNWDTSNVVDMSNMFSYLTDLTDISPLSNWDTSSVTNTAWMFYIDNADINSNLFDISPLSNWDTKNTTNIAGMFFNRNIPSLQPLSNWDVSKVQNFKSLFNTTEYSTLTSLEGLENWDVSSGTNFTYMFQDSASLVDASAINNWDIANVPATVMESEEEVDTFHSMFLRSPSHPTFTKRAGTWSNGTFLPSE